MQYLTRSDSAVIQRSMQTKISRLIDHNRFPSFPASLAGYLADLCNFDSIIMATYKASFKPIMIYPRDPAQHSRTLKTYLEESYVLDPLYQLMNINNPPTVSRLHDIAPESFKSTEYYKTCYKDFNLTDEINFLIKLDNEVSFIITLGRRESLGSITRSELNRLNDTYPMINSLVRQFWLSQAQYYVAGSQAKAPAKRALRTFGCSVLTPREQEISALILQCYSSKSIATRLKITLGTVKVHRKNIHKKLNTTTQSEMFTLFILCLNDLERTSDYG